MQIIVGILILVIMIAAFFVTYLLNKRTPVPEGTNFDDCTGCKNIHCSRSKGAAS